MRANNNKIKRKPDEFKIANAKNKINLFSSKSNRNKQMVDLREKNTKIMTCN